MIYIVYYKVIRAKGKWKLEQGKEKNIYSQGTALNRELRFQLLQKLILEQSSERSVFHVAEQCSKDPKLTVYDYVWIL